MTRRIGHEPDPDVPPREIVEVGPGGASARSQVLTCRRCGRTYRDDAIGTPWCEAPDEEPGSRRED